jgi:YVTN family beta-propeller protein
MDIENRKVVAAVQVGKRPTKVALTPDEQLLLVVNSSSSDVALIRTAQRSLLTVVPVGRGPADVVVVTLPAR